MITRQKLGLALVISSLFATLILQVEFACLYRPESIHEIQIVPAPSDLTPILFALALNWALVLPLLSIFVCGLICLLVPPRQIIDAPQWVEIKYVH